MPLQILMILTLLIGFSAGATLPKGLSICQATLEFLGTDVDEEPNVAFEVLDENSKIVGTFTGFITADGSTLLHPDFDIIRKREGISRQMVMKLMALHPNIREIRASLTWDNLDIYLEARRKRLSRTGALKETPFYKILAPFGFRSIKFRPVEDENKELLVTLQR